MTSMRKRDHPCVNFMCLIVLCIELILLYYVHTEKGRRAISPSCNVAVVTYPGGHLSVTGQ